MHRRLVIPAAVLAVAVTTLVTLVGSAPAQASYPVSRIGFRIPADGTTSGSWLGSRTLGSRPVYLIDPARKLVRTRYAAARTVKVLSSRRATARAAWILSRYGNQRGADRRYYAAATDVALDALLVGGKYSLTGAVTRRHLRQSGRAETLLSWARYFLKVSKKYAGPYRVVISKTGATVGGPVTVRARITAAATGAPIPQRPVTISYDGHAAGTPRDRQRRHRRDAVHLHTARRRPSHPADRWPSGGHDVRPGPLEQAGVPRRCRRDPDGRDPPVHGPGTRHPGHRGHAARHDDRARADKRLVHARRSRRLGPERCDCHPVRPLRLDVPGRVCRPRRARVGKRDRERER